MCVWWVCDFHESKLKASLCLQCNAFFYCSNNSPCSQQQQSTINSQLKELDRAKDAALKASSAAAPASVLAEKDSLLERKTREIEQTQVS